MSIVNIKMTYLQDHTLNQKFSSGMCGHSTLQQAFQDFKIILKLAKKLRKPIFRNYRTFWPCLHWTNRADGDEEEEGCLHQGAPADCLAQEY